VGRELLSQGLDLSDDMVRRSLRRPGLRECIKTKKPLSTKKIKHINIYGQRSACMQLGLELCHFLNKSKFNLFGSNGR
jgi:hypothetical protein